MPARRRSAQRTERSRECSSRGDHAAVFDASPDAMLVVDADGVIRDLNRQAVAMFGWSREELEGSEIERLIPDASRDRHRRHRRRYGESPKPRPMGKGLELEALHNDGTTIPVEISLSPSRLGPDQEYVICAVRDISAWRRMRRLSGMLVAAAEQERKHLSRETARRVPPEPRGTEDPGEAPGRREGRR